MDWNVAPNGYDRSKSPEMIEYRRMTVCEAKRLGNGDHIEILANDKKIRRARVTGAAKLWKKSPDRVKVPVKYGLYEHGYLEDDGSGFVTYGIIRKEKESINVQS
jgi:hypothetical protein